MPIVPLKLIPTVNSESTPALNESGISSCNLIRFKARLPEKLGGWEKFFPSSVSGIPRDIHAWQDLNQVDHLGIGTVGTGTILGVITAGTLQDITPEQIISDFTPNFSTIGGSTTIGVTDPNINSVTIQDAIFFNTPVAIGGLVLQGLHQISEVTGTSSYDFEFDSAAVSTATGGTLPSFDVTSGSQLVTVNLPSHGLAAFDEFTFPIPTADATSGITISGTYTVNAVPSASTFTISSNTQSSATTTFTMNNGSAELVYYIALGPQAAGAGYSLGGYSDGGYSTGVVPSSQVGTAITADDWTLDNWGEILLACPKGGGIYQWSPNGGFLNTQVVSTAPPFNNGIFVSMPAQILVAYGSTVGELDSTGRVLTIGDQQDPMIVRWSDQQDFTVWLASSTNQAGSYRIPRGSLIVGGLQGPQQTLLWTDLALWAMVYQGLPFVFGFNEIMSGCGLIGPHAACVMRGGVYWMGTGNFFVLGGGGPRSIPCSVWDVVFQNLDTDNQSKCVAAPNSAFDEVNFFYPSLSGGTGEIDSYVKFNIEENSWDYGTLSRTAWTDQSVLGQPIGTTPTGIIYQHETSPDADGGALLASFTTGWFTLSESRDLMFLDWFFPDMKWRYFNGSASSASVQVTIEVATYPNSAVTTFGPFTMNESKEFVNTRLRGKLVRLTFSSADVGTFWRMGNMRFRMNPDGRR
jgi:hypothetical protein